MPFVKRSISLSTSADDVLTTLVTATSQDRSAIIEASILHLRRLEMAQIVAAVQEALDAKRAGTPSGWRSLFWRGMLDAFGKDPDTFAYAVNQPYGPRTFEHFQVVFLLAPDGRETHDLTVHAFQYVGDDGGPAISMSWNCALSTSPFDAARFVSKWILEAHDRKRSAKT